MKKSQKIMALAVITIFLLSGCAARVVSISGNTSKIEKLNNAKVIWIQPAQIPMDYTVLGTSNPTEDDKKSWADYRLTGILPLLNSVKKKVPSEVELFLRKNGVVDGDSAMIIITPKEVGWTGVGPHVNLAVSVKYKNSPEVPWTIVLVAGSSIADTVDTTTNKFTSKIIDELLRAGFVSTSR